MFLVDAVGTYLDYLENRALSTAHITTVAGRLGRLTARYPGILLASLESKDINLHFREMKDSRLSEGTRAGNASTVKAFFNFCVKEGFLPYSPASQLPKLRFKPVHRRAASADAVAALVAVIPEYAAHRQFRPVDVKDSLVVSFALDCGARLGEIHSLRWVDVRHALAAGHQTRSGRVVYTVIGYGKTGASSLRFFSETAELFKLWEGLNPWKSPFVFASLSSGELVRPASLGRSFERLCCYAKIPVVRAHALRKKNVRDIIKGSGDWKMGQMFAGHENLSVTMDHYNDVLFDEVDEAAADLAELRRGGVESHLLVNALFKKLG
jgi:integrase